MRRAAALALLVLLIGATAVGGAPVEATQASTTPDAFLRDIAAFWKQDRTGLLGGRDVAVREVVTYDSDPVDGGSDDLDGSARLPACDGRVHPPAFYADNAYFCGQENVIVVDDGLLTDLRSSYGDLSVGVLLAHEYTHAVQSRIRSTAGELERELQADCFAGAWVASAHESTPIDASPSAAARVTDGIEDYGDPPARPGSTPSGHGTGAQRVDAFTRGLREGPVACVDAAILVESGRLEPGVGAPLASDS